MAVLYRNRSTFPMLLSILDKLLKAEYRRLHQVTIDLIKKNEEIHGSLDGFTYEGKYYVKDNLVKGKPKTKFLEYSLHFEMDKYLKQLERVNTDRKEIQQILMRIVDPITSEQDIRDALPECLLYTIPELSGFKRTREEAYTIRDNERDWRQYEKILPRIQFYSAARLMY